MIGSLRRAADRINLGVVLDSRGFVLLIKRVREEVGRCGARLKWAFPGGRPHKGEPQKKCVAREVRRETGYAVRPLFRIASRTHPQFSVRITYWLCELKIPSPASEPAEPHEVGEIRWVRAGRVERMFTSNFDSRVKKALARANVRGGMR